ncbi:hypothetical protein AAEX63_15400 [Luteococcus sp. H138]|uniref:hypothetical protein n=1 Tax=unclassified Luteococcus TaxID=2639923 RepID=UPI00313DABB2
MIEDQVREWARGMFPLEAGAELLIRCGRVYEGAPWIVQGSHRVYVDCERLLDAAGAWSGGERRMALVAASLLEGAPVSLYDLVPGLDRRNAALVLAAIAHAAGSHADTPEPEVTWRDGKPVAIRRGGTEPLGSLYPWPEVTQ